MWWSFSAVQARWTASSDIMFQACDLFVLCRGIFFAKIVELLYVQDRLPGTLDCGGPLCARSEPAGTSCNALE